MTTDTKHLRALLQRAELGTSHVSDAAPLLRALPALLDEIDALRAVEAAALARVEADSDHECEEADQGLFAALRRLDEVRRAK